MKEIILKDEDGNIMSRAEWAQELEYAGKLTAEINKWTYEVVGKTDEEAEQERQAGLTLQEKLNEGLITIDEASKIVRSIRDQKLNDETWRFTRYQTQRELGVETTETEEQMKSLFVYLQELRDIPQQEGFPCNIVFPQQP